MKQNINVVLVNPNEVEQLVFASFDESPSMKQNFEDNLSRFQVCQELLRKFATQIYNNRVATKYSLNTFYKTVNNRLNFADLVSPFKKALDEIKPSNDNSVRQNSRTIFNGILEAGNKLIEQKPNYPNAILRIIVMTDGCDNDFDTSKLPQLFQQLISNYIIVDAFIVSDIIDWNLVSLAKMTGGIAVKINSLSMGYKIFEREAFYNPKIRLFSHAYFDPNLIGHNFSLDFNIQKLLPPRPLKVYGAKAAAKIYENATGDSRRIKSILKQIRIVAANPNPNVHVLINQIKLDEWIAYIQTPADSNYGQKWWELYITFPECYPSIAPLFRFTTVPYHPNITSDGKVYYHLMYQNYSPEFNILDFLMEIRKLLIHPCYSEPVDTERAELYHCYNRAPTDQRDTEIKQNYDTKIKPKIEECIKENTLDNNLSNLPQNWQDAINNDSSIFVDLSSYIIPPREFQDPLTHRLMEFPVKTTTGSYFEKRILESRLSQPGDLYDPIHHTIINKEENHNLPIDLELKERIEEWKKTHLTTMNYNISI